MTLTADASQASVGAAPLVAVASVAANDAAAAEEGAVIVRCLTFSFPTSRPIIHDLSLELPPGSRCLLTGANGAGEARESHTALSLTTRSSAGAGALALRLPAFCLPNPGLPPFLPACPRRQDEPAAGAGRQVHGGAGRGADPGAPRLP